MNMVPNQDLPYVAASVGSWTGQSGRAQYLTPNQCIQACYNAGYKYAGAQYGTYCFCGNSYGKYGASTQCNMACGGESGSICGGSLANSIWYTYENSSATSSIYGGYGSVYGPSATHDASVYALSATLLYIHNNDQSASCSAQQTTARAVANVWHSGRTVAQGTHPATTGWVASSTNRPSNPYESSGLYKKRNNLTYYTYSISASNNAPALIGEYPVLPALAHAFA